MEVYLRIKYVFLLHRVERITHKFDNILYLGLYKPRSVKYNSKAVEKMHGALAKLAIALHWQCRDHRFESGKLHQSGLMRTITLDIYSNGMFVLSVE